MNNFGHYTSQKGLLGIFTEKAIWATNIKFLNDSQEFLHALELIRNIISKSKNKIAADSNEYPIYLEFIEEIENSLLRLDHFETESIYTFSVSQELDLLSQWRGYCPENSGYCLVLDIKNIHKSVKDIFPNTHLLTRRSIVSVMQHNESSHA